MDQLVELYGVEDEDHLPIPFDFLELLDTDKEDREDLLKDKLADCPAGACVCAHTYSPRSLPRTPPPHSVYLCMRCVSSCLEQTLRRRSQSA